MASIIISLNEYNELKEIKTNIDKIKAEAENDRQKVLVNYRAIDEWGDQQIFTVKYEDRDEALREIKKHCDAITDEIKEKFYGASFFSRLKYLFTGKL
jgi:multidrug efflux pump subunit AcrB